VSAATAAVERREVQAPGLARPTADPNLLEKGQKWLRSFVAYTCKVFGLRKGLEAVQHTRQEPTISTSVVAAALFFCGLLRIRSLNALEPKLREKPFVRLVGGAGKKGGLGSAQKTPLAPRPHLARHLARAPRHLGTSAPRPCALRPCARAIGP